MLFFDQHVYGATDSCMLFLKYYREHTIFLCRLLRCIHGKLVLFVFQEHVYMATYSPPARQRVAGKLSCFYVNQTDGILMCYVYMLVLCNQTGGGGFLGSFWAPLRA